MDPWKIIYYETPQGASPVYDFIERLDAKAKSKVINTLDLLEESGLAIGVPHVKKVVGTNLWELRLLGKNNIRIFYVAINGRAFLLLHGFIKKKQKTDLKEIKTALERLKEFLSRTSI